MVSVWLVVAYMWPANWPKMLVVLMGALAFSLSFMLDGFLFGFNATVESLRDTQLVVSHRGGGGGGGLPLAHRDRIASVDGVTAVRAVNGFGATHHETPNEGLGISGIEPAMLQDASFYDDVRPEQLAAFEATPDGAVIGLDLARTRGWAVGDRVPLRAWNMERQDGATTWHFTVVGTYDTRHDIPTSNFYARFSYIDGLRANGKGRASRYFVDIEDAGEGGRVMAEIDGMFANSPDPTRTISMRDRARANVQRMGNVSLLITATTNATFLAMAVVLAAVLAQTFRDRSAEIAVMRVLGFRLPAVTTLFFVEAAAYVGLGLLAGLAIARLVAPATLGALGLDDLGVPGNLLLRNALIAAALALGIAACAVATGWGRNIRQALDARR